MLALPEMFVLLGTTKGTKTMRNLIIGAAALLAMAAPSMAAAETGGSIRFTYASLDGGLDDNFCECNDSKDSMVALGGTVVTDLSHEGWRLQFNGASADMEHNEHSDAMSQVEVHAVKDLGQVEVGAFAGMFNNNGWNFNEVGVEAAMNFEKGRIAVSAVTANSANASFFDETTSVAATGTFNLNDSWSLGATISSTDFGNFADANNGEVDSYGVSVSYRVPDTSLAITLGYRSSEADNADLDFVGVSLSWGFGEGARGREMPGATALIADAMVIE